MIRTIMVVLPFMATLMMCASASAQASPFDELVAFAERICKDVPLESRTTKTELSGQAKAELSNFLKRLADIGGEVKGSRVDTATSGVLQDQLAGAIAKGNDCRQAVVHDFRDMVLKAPAPKSRNEPPPINNEIFRPPQQQPTAGSIAEAGFAIGDSIDKLRTAGIAGQFNTNPVTKKMQFTAPVTIPVGSGPGGPAYKQGFVAYQFDNSKISAIVIRIIEQMDCAFVQWPNELFSAAIRDLGEPVEPARTWTITESINLVPYAEARTGYRFSANGEERIVILTNATGVNMSLLKMCGVEIIRGRAGSG